MYTFAKIIGLNANCDRKIQLTEHPPSIGVYAAVPYCRMGSFACEVFEHNEIQLSKRSIERFLEGVSWLETSSDSAEQLDGCGRSSVQLVFSFLLSDARRKRRKVYFASLHAIDGEPQVLGDDAFGVSSPEPVLVVQDGRGAKKWMLLQNDNLETINSAFKQLCPEALCSIFPTGPLVELYRAQPNLIPENQLSHEFTS